MIGQDNARFPTPDQPRVGIVRGLPNVYEVNQFGQTVSTIPTAAWHKGELIRSSAPTVRLTTPTPQYDSSDPNTQAGWTRATS